MIQSLRHQNIITEHQQQNQNFQLKFYLKICNQENQLNEEGLKYYPAPLLPRVPTPPKKNKQTNKKKQQSNATDIGRTSCTSTSY